MKYLLVVFASIIVLLHSFIPHLHESELSLKEHVKVHETNNSGSLDFLSLMFHEFTEDGQMEDFVVDNNQPSASEDQQILSSTVLYVVALTLFNFEVKYDATPFNFYHEPAPHFSGYAEQWSVRPPPFA